MVVDLPVQSLVPWTPERLEDLEDEELDALARASGRALVASRVLLGRCLLELDRRGLAHEWGFSGAIHYAILVLKISRKAAREARRVARGLQALPRMAAKAEAGELGWSHLREAVRVATPETEAAWIQAAERLRWRVFARLVRQAGPGDLPGQADHGPHEADLTRLTVVVRPEDQVVLSAGLARLSREFGRLLDMGEAVALAFASLLTGSEADLKRKLRKAQELLEDLQADREEREQHEDQQALAAAERALDESRPTRVAPEDALGDAEPPGPRPPFAWPAPASGADRVCEPEGLERTPWAMASVHAEACPGAPDFTLLWPDRRPFWDEPEGTRGPQRERKRREAIARGARTRFGSAETRRTVMVRDRFECRCPECPNSVWVERHHLSMYCEGGLSVPENEVLLCQACHRNVHEGRLRISGTVSTGLEWRDAQGRLLGAPSPEGLQRARQIAQAFLATHVGPDALAREG